MTPAESHALEKLLADVAGVEVKEGVRYGLPAWIMLDGLETEWTPFDTHEGPFQMELVKAGLLKAGAVYETKWCGEGCAIGYRNLFLARVYDDIIKRRLRGATIRERKDPESEAMALALAVKAWKEQTDGHSDSTKSV